jgi:hypothetical protein
MLVRRLRFLSECETVPVVQEILTASRNERAEDLLRGEADKLQDVCDKNRLPVDRWRAITADRPGDSAACHRGEADLVAIRGDRDLGCPQERISDCIGQRSGRGRACRADRLRIGFLALKPGEWPDRGWLRAARSDRRDHPPVRCDPAQLWLACPSLDARHSRSEGKGVEDLVAVVRSTLEDWVAVYRSDLEADLTDLRLPIVTIQGTLGASRRPRSHGCLDKSKQRK